MKHETWNMEHEVQNIKHESWNMNHQKVERKFFMFHVLCSMFYGRRGCFMLHASCSISRGFTLIELLVSIGIFTLITTMAVFSQGQFNSSIVLTNLAYEVALSIRQAQVYGVTVKASGDVARVFNSGYGIHFFDSGSVTEYTLFEDMAPDSSDYESYPDHVYIPSDDTAIEKFYLTRGNKIKKICFNNINTICTSSDVVDITFLRPNPEATITSSYSSLPASITEVDICLTSPDDSNRKIIVENTGQISVAVVPPSGDVCN